MTIKKRINRLFEIRQMIDVGKFDLMPKMEQEQLLVEQKQLNHLLSGIETMKELPDCIFLVNSVYESKVIKEAQKLKIPLIGFCDTDGDPDVFEAFVPLNDDYFRPIELVLQYLVEQYAAAVGLTLPPPTPKPESEINRDMQLKSRRNIARRSRRVRNLRRFSNVKSNHIIVTGLNYRTVTANGRSTTTAVQADEQLVDLTGRKIYLYDRACEEYFVTGYARRFAVPDDFSQTKEEQ